MLQGSLLAVLALSGRQPFRFESPDQSLLDSFVAQAAVAIHNARLYRQAEERQKRLTTLVAVTQRLTQDLHLPAVLEAIAEAAAMVFGERRASGSYKENIWCVWAQLLEQATR
jgi:GAF domain-containing protein